MVIKIFFFLLRCLSIEFFLRIRAAIRPDKIKSENEFYMYYTLISIINKIFSLKNQKEARKHYKLSLIRSSIIYKYAMQYLRLFWKHLPKIAATDPGFEIISANTNKGRIYVSFHFAGNLEIMTYYLSLIHDECYFIASDLFEKNIAQIHLGKKDVHEVGDMPYWKHYNKDFRIKFIMYNESGVVFRIIRLLRQGKPIVILFDEFMGVSTNKMKENKQYVEYKIKGKRAAIVPRSLFYILSKSNAELVSLVNLRKGYVKNQLRICGPIKYNYTKDNFNTESERILKELYNFFLLCILQNPYLIETGSLRNFIYYVLSNGLLTNVSEKRIPEITNRFRSNGQFVLYEDNKNNTNVIMRLDDLKTAKIDNLTKDIFMCIRKKNRITRELSNSYYQQHILSRITNLYDMGFIISS